MELPLAKEKDKIKVRASGIPRAFNDYQERRGRRERRGFLIEDV
jgi:hypothetical protein